MALATNPTHKVLMLPGQYDGREGLIHGPDTIEALQHYRADKAFLGASGLTSEGPSDAGIGPGLIYGAMMRAQTRSCWRTTRNSTVLRCRSMAVVGRT